MVTRTIGEYVGTGERGDSKEPRFFCKFHAKRGITCYTIVADILYQIWIWGKLGMELVLFQKFGLRGKKKTVYTQREKIVSNQRKKWNIPKDLAYHIKIQKR